MDTKIRVNTESWPSGKKFLLGLERTPFQYKSGTLTCELSLLFCTVLLYWLWSISLLLLMCSVRYCCHGVYSVIFTVAYNYYHCGSFYFIMYSSILTVYLLLSSTCLFCHIMYVIFFAYLFCHIMYIFCIPLLSHHACYILCIPLLSQHVYSLHTSSVTSCMLYSLHTSFVTACMLYSLHTSSVTACML